MTSTLHALISDYGYWAVLVGTFLEGETIVVLAGLAAHNGYLGLPGVILAAFAGSTSGDQLYYWIGRRYGTALLDRRPTWRVRFDVVHRMLLRHQDVFILGFRFLYGLRAVSPFLIGMSDVRPRRFALLNVMGAAIWAVSFSTVGYLLGTAVELMLVRAKRYERYVFGAILFVGFLLWVWRRWKGRREAARLAAAPADPT
ncbi:MAG: DedA family protein [Myxococcota bacterium]